MDRYGYNQCQLNDVFLLVQAEGLDRAAADRLLFTGPTRSPGPPSASPQPSSSGSGQSLERSRAECPVTSAQAFADGFIHTISQT